MDLIYLDHAATAPLRVEVREAMMSVWAEMPGNPSSVHGPGRRARSRLESARERLAAVLGAKAREVVFTAGGTEADNLAVLGRWRASRARGESGPVVCSAVEHRAVLGAAWAATQDGAEVVALGVDEQGRVQPDAVREALAARPSVVSVQWGNNEVGTLQPVTEIAGSCREAGIVFHTDAVQAFGRERIRVDEIWCDLLSVSGHKIGGPAGIGALYVRDGVELAPLGHGGGQERGLRPGTENVVAAEGFAVAAELAERDRAEEAARQAGLRDRLEHLLGAGIPGLIVNGGGAPRLPHVLNVSIPGVDPDALLAALDLEGLAVSSGSACRSGSVQASHVLVAMGRAVPGEAAIRLSVGRETTAFEIEEAGLRFVRVVERVRSLAGP